VGEVMAWRLINSAEAAREVREALLKNPPDIVIALPTVAVFAALLEAAIESVDVPILLLNLEDSEHPFKLETTYIANLIQHSHGLAVQAFSNVLMRRGQAFEVATTKLNGAECVDELRARCAAAMSPRALRLKKLALFGHVFEDMRDVLLDRQRLEKQLGLHVQLISVSELKETYRTIPAAAIQTLNAQLRQRFQVAEMPQEEWMRSLRLVCAYRTLCQRHQIAGGALNSHGPSGLDDSEIGIMSTLALSLLTDDGISLAEVGDLQTGIALFLARQLGVRAMYAELDFVDRENNRWFIANSGELDLHLVDPKRPAWIRSNVNFQGACGGGAAFDAAVQPGPATLFSFTEGPHESYRLIVAQGEVLPDRSEVLQLVNCSFRPRGVSALEGFGGWCAAGAVHHAALAPGHISRSLQTISHRLGIHCLTIS
jgi:L-arabinose isomerase